MVSKSNDCIPMPVEAYPTDAKEQFIFLVGQAERYIKQDDVGPSGTLQVKRDKMQ
jgi:hypothetical protein